MNEKGFNITFSADAIRKISENFLIEQLKIEIEQLKIEIEQLKIEIEQLDVSKIKLKEMTNSIINTYALYTTDKDVNILFINYERFQNEPKLYKIVDKLNYDYKVYLNKKNEILFATWDGLCDSKMLTLNITEQNFSNFDIIKEFFYL